LVYDISIKETFQKVEKWVEELKIFNKEIDFVIVGNKLDLNKYDVNRDEINNFSINNKIPNFYTSAKTGEGVNDVFDIVFQRLAMRYVNMNNDTNYKKKGLVVCEDIKQKKKKGCC
jgi:GTPase SAR1 family protein